MPPAVQIDLPPEFRTEVTQPAVDQIAPQRASAAIHSAYTGHSRFELSTVIVDVAIHGDRVLVQVLAGDLLAMNQIVSIYLSFFLIFYITGEARSPLMSEVKSIDSILMILMRIVHICSYSSSAFSLC